MRVGFDARWYNDSGVGVYVAELVRAVGASPRDFEFIVYEDPRNRIPGLEALAVERIPVQAPKYSVAEQFELTRRARLDELDVFHSPFFIVPVGVRCPVVVTVYDLIPFLFPMYPWPKEWMVKLGYRIAARRARHILVPSQNTARDIRMILRVPDERISSIHIAARSGFEADGGTGELERLKEKHAVRPPYVVVSSARNWRTKNLESALKALEIARRQSGLEFQTVVYGPSDGLDALGPEERWQTINLRRAGYVESGDLAMLFRNAHAFIMPSLYEGFGLPVLEAMSCGCPVIASNVGAVTEVAGDGAQLFHPLDIDGMARATVTLLCNPEALRRWKVSALMRAKHFSWSKTALQTISVYHRTLASRSKSRKKSSEECA
jgi:glycosyltransferase involved in cell wall biosynthesis